MRWQNTLKVFCSVQSVLTLLSIGAQGQNNDCALNDALAFRNGMEYRYLNVCINSANDASISCENFVKFGAVTPQLTELICERMVRHGQKNWRILSNISGSPGPIFANFTSYESTLGAHDKSGPYFPIWQGTLPW